MWISRKRYERLENDVKELQKKCGMVYMGRYVINPPPGELYVIEIKATSVQVAIDRILATLTRMAEKLGMYETTTPAKTQIILRPHNNTREAGDR